LANPWTRVTLEDGRRYDEQKEISPYRERMMTKNMMLRDVIQKYLPKNKKLPILDLGSGTGIWSIFVAKKGYNAICTDISEGILDRAKERVRKEKLQGKIIVETADICDLSKYKTNSFSFVMAIGDILSYCSDAKKALKEIKRVTKPGGILLGDVENRYKIFDGRRAQSWKDVRRILNGGDAFWQADKNSVSIRQYTPTELKNLLNKSGWKTLEMSPSHLMWSLFNEQFLQEAINSKDGMKEIFKFEKEFSKDVHLLGSGFEIRYVAKNLK